ncbi:MAG TPA: AmmeMemoRadiSam system protein B [Polyangia bacterium]
MAPHPKLRPLVACPGEGEGKSVICLRDPSGLTENVALVPRPVMPLLVLFDGSRSVTEVQVDFMRLRGELIPRESIESLVGQLDEALLLDSRRFHAHRARVTAEFLAAPARPPAHAGGSYPAEQDALRRMLDGFFADAEAVTAMVPPLPLPPAEDGAPDHAHAALGNGAPHDALLGNGAPHGELLATGGPHDAPAAPPRRPRRPRRSPLAPMAPPRRVSDIRAVVAPHIDLGRGGPVYAQAYQPLLDDIAADLYVILGTDHNGEGSLYSLTRKSYETPLGLVQTDEEAVAAVARRGGGPALLRGEINHRREHSIEFQAVFLRYLAARRQDDRAPLILPILCGSFHEFIEGEADPATDARIADLCGAVAEVARGRRVVYIAAADLAHVGPQFGDEAPVDEDDLEQLAANDTALLDAVVAADPVAFFGRLRAEGDRRRVCGLPPIYTLLRMCGEAAGEVLAYDQCASGPDDDSCVSIAAMVLRGA